MLRTLSVSRSPERASETFRVGRLILCYIESALFPCGNEQRGMDVTGPRVAEGIIDFRGDRSLGKLVAGVEGSVTEGNGLVTDGRAVAVTALRPVALLV